MTQRLTFLASVSVLIVGASAVSLADGVVPRHSASAQDPYSAQTPRDLASQADRGMIARPVRDYAQLAQVSGNQVSGSSDLSGGPLAKSMPLGTAPQYRPLPEFPSSSSGYGSYNHSAQNNIAPSYPELAGGAGYQGAAQSGQYTAPSYPSVYQDPYQGQTYPIQNNATQNYPSQNHSSQTTYNGGPNMRPAAQNTQKRSWWQKLGLGNLAFSTDGFLRAGYGAVERDFNDNDQTGESVGDAMLRGEVSAITQGGLEYGVSLKLRGQHDRYRRGFGGSTAVFGTGDCPAGIAGCNSVVVDATARSVRGHTGQLYNADYSDIRKTEYALEGAHLFLRSAYGDVTLGRDDGAASLFSLEGPSTMPLARSANTRVDYTGLDMTKTINDASGFAEKITYISPRLLGDSIGFGVQFGASYAPSTDVCGVDYCVRGNDYDNVNAILSPDLDDALELGVAIDRTFDNGFSAELALNYASASEQSGLAVFDDLSSYGAGLRLSYDAFSFGASYLSSNNGWAGDGDYSAYEAALTWQPNAWGVTASFGQSTDDVAQSEGRSALLGVSYDVNENYTLAAGVQQSNRDVPVYNGTDVVTAEQKATGLFIEGGIRF